MIPFDSLETKALEVHNRLCAEYHCPISYFGTLDPLSDLVSSLLSHRTKNTDSSRAFRTLRERFPTWEAVRDAETSEVQEAISATTWPEQKAPRLQSVLREITSQRGALELNFLQEMEVRAARNWLEQLPGVGPKTSAAVLAFSSLRRAALPVDSHHHRVAQRVGLIGVNIAVGPSHAILEALLPPDWNAQQVYDHHEVLMLHGQNVCFFLNPACHRCVLLDICPEGLRRVNNDA
jgi:endonuclease-3